MFKQEKRNDTDCPNLEELLSLNEAAKLSGLSHDHLRRLAGQGKIWAKKIGRNWITTKQAVMKYMENKRSPGRPKKTKTP